MADKSLAWCFSLKDGLRIIEPNDRLSSAYLEQAKASLYRSEKNLEEEDLLWATVALYYAEYYALYSFLQKIGIKCENHACSIKAAAFLLGDTKIAKISKHREKRIDAQYYIKVGQEQNVSEMLKEAKEFVSWLDGIVSIIPKKDVQEYRKRLIAESVR